MEWVGQAKSGETSMEEFEEGKPPSFRLSVIVFNLHFAILNLTRKGGSRLEMIHNSRGWSTLTASSISLKSGVL